jgi:hypothetical protein
VGNIARWVAGVPWTGPQRTRPRLAGAPPSPNGASSFHLWWDLARKGPFAQVSATLEVVQAPVVTKLYFWALQVSFVEGGRDLGAGHTGLQWHPGAPEGAVNWGGYSPTGGELAGSGSALRPVDGPNTFHYPWHPGRKYLLRVWSPAAGQWRSDVTDLAAGITTTVRDLYVAASGLANPVVWSEVFASCDDPGTEVRWSDLAATDFSGQAEKATSCRLTYQSHEDGGCANTVARAGPTYFAQVTGLPYPRPPAPEVLAIAGPPGHEG